MIRVNLLPLKEAQRALGRRRQLSVALLSISVALLVMVIPYVLQGRQLAGVERDIDQLNAEVAKLNEQTREVRDLDKRKAELQAKLKVIDNLKQKRVGPVRMLEDLSAAVPEKLWLVDFSDANNQATITGLALDNQTIATFMRQLQTSKYFYNVDLVETAQSQPVKGTAAGDVGMVFKKFIVKAQLDYLGAGGKAQSVQTTAPPAGSKSGA
jgi:type IV pilus assembly protein PilN